MIKFVSTQANKQTINQLYNFNLLYIYTEHKIQH
jgi:hypothetical protein